MTRASDESLDSEESTTLTEAQTNFLTSVGDKLVNSKESTTLSETQTSFLALSVEGRKFADSEESTTLNAAQTSFLAQRLVKIEPSSTSTQYNMADQGGWGLHCSKSSKELLGIADAGSSTRKPPVPRT